MVQRYTDERNVQILIALLKAHGIHRVIASPGTTNITLVASLQHDSFFVLYSAADERSAAYMACGMAEDTGEPVMLSCTGATASRNYLPGLTEAYYRKLPVLAVTSTPPVGRVGQAIAQVIDRSCLQHDVARLSIHVGLCHNAEDEWSCNVHINRAILELTRSGGGPVHIDLETGYSRDYAVCQLPDTRVIRRIETGMCFPELPHGRIGVFVGAHSRWSVRQTKALESFCKANDSIVLCDQTSNYRGWGRVLFSLVTSQSRFRLDCNDFDLLIHIGNISGAYPSIRSKLEWRVNPDGEVRDTFHNLEYVFQMSEESFFEHYTAELPESSMKYSNYRKWAEADSIVRERLVEVPFSNVWLASNMAASLPAGSVVFLGILNTLRAWNFFETPNSVDVYANTGGFGIDGTLSTALGASVSDKKRITYCILGDLAFFYDMNALGNRHLGSNLRILLVNNGRGTEFRNYNHPGAAFGKEADALIAAAGHYGSKSRHLVRHYAEDLGFEYYSASNKNDAREALGRFLDPAASDKPYLFEVFTNSKDESDALYTMMHLLVEEEDSEGATRKSFRKAIKNVVGPEGIRLYRSIRYGDKR